MEKLYSQYPEVLAYFAIVDGKLVFDFDEHKVPLEQIVVALNTVTSEYLKAIADSSQNNKE